jgi:alcohol dehydrogenase class IV
MTPAKLDFEVPAHLQRDFVFQTAGILPPNGLFFGYKTIRKLGEVAAKMGAKQALLVTDETMVQLGYAELAKELLEKEKIGVEVYGKVEPEPHLETAEALYEIVKKTSFDLIVGLGGGSPMDMAKLTALAATNNQTPRQLLVDKVVRKAPLKKILLPTTSGTGSEVSMFLVSAIGKDKYPILTAYNYPEVAIIDPGLTLSMPPRVTASTGIDALSHAIDSLMHKLANPLYDSLGLAGIELVGKYLRRATFDGQDLEARYYMSMGATLCMMSLTGTGGLYSHAISYVLAMYQPTVHGIGCGVGLPYTMAFNAPLIEEKLATVARALGAKIESLSLRAAAKRAAELVRDLIADVNLPVSLKQMGVQHEDVYKMAEICVTKYPRSGNPRDLSKEDARILFEAMWQGDLNQI